MPVGKAAPPRPRNPESRYALHDFGRCQAARGLQADAPALGQIIGERGRIDEADTSRGDAALHEKIGNRRGRPQAQRVCATVEEIGIEQARDIGDGYRTEGQPITRTGDFHQRLEPEQTARTIAHQFDGDAATPGLAGNRQRHRIRTQGQRGGIARYVDRDAHRAASSASISASKDLGVTRACKLVSSI